MTRPLKGRLVGKVQRYRLERLISQDWLGEIWSARHARLDRDVTLRVFGKDLGSSPHFVHRLREQLGRLHPGLVQDNIARVLSYNYGEDGPVQFEVMERLEGIPVSGRRRSAASALRVAADVALALEAAHVRGITHGGLSGDMVLVTDRGVKVVDFGVAAAVWNAARDEETTGVPGRKLPRSAYDLGEPSASADLLALEGLLSQMITGPSSSGDTPGLPSRIPAPAAAILEQMRTLLDAAAAHPDPGSAHGVATALRAAAEEVDALSPKIEVIFAPGPEGSPGQAAAGPTTVEVPESRPSEPRITLPEPVLTRAVEKAPAPPGGGIASPGRARPAPKVPGTSRGRVGREVPRAVADPPPPQRAPSVPPVPPMPPATAAPRPAPAPPAEPSTKARAPWAAAAWGKVAPAVARQRRLVAGRAAALARASGRGVRGMADKGLVTARSLRQAVSRKRRAVMDGTALVLALVAAVMVFMFVLPASHEGAGLSAERVATAPSDTPAPAPTISGVRVPDVTGLTALEASGELARLGFVVAAAQPTTGPPGEVARTTPSAGAVVAPGTAVVLFIGTDPGREGDQGS